MYNLINLNVSLEYDAITTVCYVISPGNCVFGGCLWYLVECVRNISFQILSDQSLSDTRIRVSCWWATAFRLPLGPTQIFPQ
jgi:hypothetical protein